jgi:4-diphosphocytidyl-2-C-methyl-D-erythritol kinase
MVQFPHAKINLGLSVKEKRTDGYHNIETVFYPIPLHDALEIIPAPGLISPSFRSYGLPIPGNVENNLCVKAWHLIKADHPQLPPVEIFLLKKIPMGAGLGGGSSDGAYMLTMLDAYFDLQLSTAELEHYALRLGSDCPFFIRHTPVFATGRGEIMEPVSADITGYSILMVYPGIHVSTAEAFSAIQATRETGRSIAEIVHTPVTNWKDKLVNDFEHSVFGGHPELAALKEQLYKMGAAYASMTGTGSAFYALFHKKQDVSTVFPSHYVHSWF